MTEKDTLPVILSSSVQCEVDMLKELSLGLSCSFDVFEMSLLNEGIGLVIS